MKGRELEEHKLRQEYLEFEVREFTSLLRPKPSILVPPTLSSALNSPEEETRVLTGPLNVLVPTKPSDGNLTLYITDGLHQF